MVNPTLDIKRLLEAKNFLKAGERFEVQYGDGPEITLFQHTRKRLWVGVRIGKFRNGKMLTTEMCGPVNFKYWVNRTVEETKEVAYGLSSNA